MNNKAEDPTLWNDASEAQKLMRERQQLDDSISGVKALEQQLKDNIELIELGEMEGDDEIVKDAEDSLKALKNEANRRQVEAMLSGEADGNDTYLEVHSGAGGTESRIGRTCCCACIPAGPTAKASRLRCWKFTTAKRLASNPRRFSSRATMLSAG